MSQNNEVSYILNEPIVWEGDLDDDCTVRDWHGMMGRAEAMSEWSWFCCVYRGKETLMHNSTDGFNPNSGESARKLVEMYMRLEALRGLVAPAPEPQGESREEEDGFDYVSPKGKLVAIHKTVVVALADDRKGPYADTHVVAERKVMEARVAELERDRASNVSQMTRDLERLDRIGEALGGCAPEQSVEERAIEVGARVKELEDRVSKRDMRIKELFGGCACRDFPGQMREPKIVCLYHQAKAKEAAAQAAELSRLTTERDRLAGQLAATVENYKLTVASWNAEDSRLRQQLAAEQARLDWVLANEVDSVILVDFPEGVREAIDAEMKNPQSKYIQSNYMAIARQQLAERDVEIAELEASQADYRDCIELAGKIAEGIECYDGDDLAGEIVPYLKPVVGELDALRQQLAETVGALKVANLKNAHSLANNLCPDHRDKQQGKPCLACEIERLRAGEAEVRQALVAMFVDAISGMADAAIINADQTYDYRNTAAAVRQLSEEHKKLRLQPHSEEVSSLTRQLEEARGLIGMYPEFHACLDQTACPDGWVECPICEGGGSDSGKKNKPTHKPGCPRGKFSQSTSPAVEEAGKGDGSGSEGVA